jgi:osomolarity two-component system response regulator SKN7
MDLDLDMQNLQQTLLPQQQQEQQQQQQMFDSDNQNQGFNTTASVGVQLSGSISNNNQGTEFVKKLFQMLEENRFGTVVKWSETGDSFMITDTNEFTKQVLPCYFKHSNFSSFVRQLNKYDFHKVKVSPELKQRYQLENVWEFRHPDFNRFNKQTLENIKRKVPAKKEPPETVAVANCITIQSYRKLQDRVVFLEKENENLNKSINSMKSSLHKLNQKYNSLVSNLLTGNEVNNSFSKTIETLYKAINQLGVQLPPLDLPHLDLSDNHIQTNTNGGTGSVLTLNNKTSNTRDKYNSISKSTSSDTPITDTNTASRDNNHNSNNKSNSNNNSNNNSDNNDNNNSDNNDNNNKGKHVIHNTTTNTNIQDTNIQQQKIQVKNEPNHEIKQSGPLNSALDPQARLMNRPKGSALHVLLVEDDDVCIQLCRKFLMKYGCTVVVVTDGLSAISAVEQVKFDLVLMDIVMPNLDGATATSVIRSFDHDTPIIAMTGNYQRNDLMTYLNHGMTDILAKPFTKDDLYMILEKHKMDKMLNFAGKSPEDDIDQLQKQQKLIQPQQQQQHPVTPAALPSASLKQTASTSSIQLSTPAHSQLPPSSSQQTRTQTQQVHPNPIQQHNMIAATNINTSQLILGNQKQTQQLQIHTSHLTNKDLNINESINTNIPNKPATTSTTNSATINNNSNSNSSSNIAVVSSAIAEDILTPSLLETTGLIPDTNIGLNNANPATSNALSAVEMDLLGVSEAEFGDIFKRRKLL